MNCPDCNGTGRVQLLFSDVACDCSVMEMVDGSTVEIHRDGGEKLRGIRDLFRSGRILFRGQDYAQEQVRVNLEAQGEINEHKAQNRAVLDAFSMRSNERKAVMSVGVIQFGQFRDDVSLCTVFTARWADGLGDRRYSECRIYDEDKPMSSPHGFDDLPGWMTKVHKQAMDERLEAEALCGKR